VKEWTCKAKDQYTNAKSERKISMMRNERRIIQARDVEDTLHLKILITYRPSAMDSH